ncbi:MAG: hypothetical protein IM574_11510 [Cytophagales bacterium]|jgi:predicted chitinase|nr:hypothetical protein [Cytophagales bacterium]MCA6386944.1 hypothetical protein [Cytophagales bacterium]MCA6391867.1 hypothetical protein [Cytophagales bacterium]MCA6395229.1 hypothetical protein [Cytophagales bacterium]MCA6398437.1 hypothetical protein [Cytophagales bacterium]
MKEETILGAGDGVESELIALYDAQAPVTNNNSPVTKTQVLGKLSVITYDEIVKDLVIVPINGNKYPYDEGVLRTKLNKIYGQAVVKWNITFAQNFDVPGIDPFDDGGSGLLSNYSPDMRKVVSAYKANLQRNTYYLFLVKNPKSGTDGTVSMAGFMPRSKECGFIFVDKNGSEESIIRTMAHELGHGVFHLRHTFDKGEKNMLPEKGTDNLMDYANGNKLFKYQWDRMRYPEIVMGLFEEDEDGAMVTNLSGLTALVNSDTLKADKIFVITGNSFKLDAKHNVTNGGEVSFRLTIKPEGGGADVLHPSDDWKKVNNNENWVLDLNSVTEGKYILSYKVGTTTTTADFYVRTAAHDYACGVCGRNLLLTDESLKEIFPNSKIIANDPNVLTYFNEALKKGGFSTCYCQAHFLSQVYEESGGMNASVEGSNYDTPGILTTYRKNSNIKDIFFKQTFWDNKIYLEYASIRIYETSPDTTITKYEGEDYKTFKWNDNTKVDTVKIPTSFAQKKSSEYKKNNLTEAEKTSHGAKLFNLVYANKNGNGNEASGDGNTYRGRGAIQLTGRGTYRGVSDKCNEVFGTSYNWETDFSPLENENKAIVYSVAGFFLWKLALFNKSMTALDTNNVTAVTTLVNGGSTGLDTRKSKFNTYIQGRLNNCKIKK